MNRIIFALLIFFASSSEAKAGLFDSYLKHFRKIMSNYSFDYTMTCTYPDSTVLDVKGKIAVSGNNYYDSSNLRYVFLNETWYLIANHNERQVSAAYIKDLNKELEEIGSFSVANYLMSEDYFENHVAITVSKQNEDTLWLNLTSEDKILERMEVEILRDGLIPTQYTVRANYPLNIELELDDEHSTPAMIKLDIRCYNIQTPVPEKLFDHSRLVSKEGNKATLKKFKNYKIII